MNARFLCYITFVVSLTLFSYGYAQQSITGNINTYLETCSKAVKDSYYFQNFRSLPEYAPILECGFVGESVQYLLEKGSPHILSNLEAFEKLDRVGNPIVHDIPRMGHFSGTTLRYVVIVDQLIKLFNLPPHPKIVEIGAGFGGQCYILSQVLPFSKYYIHDLLPVEQLIGKVMKTLAIENIHLLPEDAALPEEKIDLLISNYAFSECDRQTQLDYFERVLKKADRGYVIFNQISSFDTLSLGELLTLLKDNHMNPETLEEPIFTYQGNLLIIWDKTKA